MIKSTVITMAATSLLALSGSVSACHGNHKQYCSNYRIDARLLRRGCFCGSHLAPQSHDGQRNNCRSD